MKVLKYKLFKRLSEQDFVKQKTPEQAIFEDLKNSFEQSIIDKEFTLSTSDKNESYLNSIKNKKPKEYEKLKNDEDFIILSKDEYKEMKESIKQRKEAKARLLKQGYPDLKNYVYL